jgi:hypothetical protein
MKGSLECPHHANGPSRRIEPISRSAYPFCHGERDDLGLRHVLLSLMKYHN